MRCLQTVPGRILYFMTKTKLLIVDDDNNIRRCLELLFSRDYDVYLGADGLEGYKLWKENSIDIILTDLAMPHMTGEELCLKIREHDTKAKIFAVSGHHDLLNESSEVNIGFNDFINKPVNFEDLKTLVKNAEEALYS